MACVRSREACEVASVGLKMSVLLWVVVDVSSMGMATDTALALCSYCQKFQVDCCSFKRSQLLNGTSAAAADDLCYLYP